MQNITLYLVFYKDHFIQMERLYAVYLDPDKAEQAAAHIRDMWSTTVRVQRCVTVD